MALAEDIIFADPILQRIFFDGRRFAPRDTPENVAAVSCLEMAITDDKVIFLKATKLATAEALQIKMRARWFLIRRRCDGYFLKMPAGYSDGCEHVEGFRHVSNARYFNVDRKRRSALWWRYERHAPPDAWQLRP